VLPNFVWASILDCLGCLRSGCLGCCHSLCEEESRRWPTWSRTRISSGLPDSHQERNCQRRETADKARKVPVPAGFSLLVLAKIEGLGSGKETDRFSPRSRASTSLRPSSARRRTGSAAASASASWAPRPTSSSTASSPPPPPRGRLEEGTVAVIRELDE
jgi:hypothetical protein